MQSQTLPTPRPATPVPNVRPNIATAARPLTASPASTQTLSLDAVITTMVNAAEGFDRMPEVIDACSDLIAELH